MPLSVLHLSELLDRAEDAKQKQKTNELLRVAEKLVALNPMAVLLHCQEYYRFSFLHNSIDLHQP